MTTTTQPTHALFDPLLAHACDPEKLAALLDLCGWPAGLAKKTRDARVMAQALFVQAVPASTADALAMATSFAARRGPNALWAAAIDAREHGHFEDGRAAKAFAKAGAPPLDEWGFAVPIDLALAVARAWVLDEDAVMPIVERAEHHLARFLPDCVPWEYAARSPALSPCTMEDAAAIAREVAGSRGRSSWVRAFYVTLPDGVVAIAVMRVAAPTNACDVVDEHGPARATQRALAVDVLRLDVAARRISVTTAEPSLAPAYAEAFGAALWGAARALVGHPAVTLKTIQALGRAGLAKVALPAPVTGHAAAVALEHDDRYGARKSSRGPRAFASIEPDVRRGGYLASGTLRLPVEGARRPVDAYIALPNRLSISDARFAAPVRAAMSVLGVFSPGSLADDSITLAPWTHAEWRWREVLGDERVNAMIAVKLLVPAKARVRGGSGEGAERKLGAGVRGFALTNARDAGRFYAISADESVRPRTVRADENAELSLDVAALTKTMRAALGLAAGERIALPAGFTDVGVLELSAGRVRVVRLARAVARRESKRLGDALRRAARGQHVVVLVPEGRTLSGAAAEVPLSLGQQLGADGYDGVLSAAAAALGLEDAMPAWSLATSARPLVADVQNDRITLGAVLLDLTPNQRAMVKALAGPNGGPTGAGGMGPKDLGLAISPRATIPDQIVRKACLDLDERVARSFADAGVVLPGEWRTLVVQDRRTGYRLAVGSVVRA